MIELIDTIGLIAVFGGIAVAAVIDLRKRIIPNELVLLVALGGVAVQIGLPQPLWAGVVAAAAVLIGFGLLSGAGLIGAGDAKLIAAATLSIPLTGIPPLLLNIVVAGGGLACIYFIAARRSPSQKRQSRKRPAGAPPAMDIPAMDIPAMDIAEPAMATFPLRPPLKASMPYAPAILLGMAWHMGSQVLS